VRQLVRFAEELRQAGFAADPASIVQFVRGVQAVGVTDRDATRSCGAVIFARNREQIALYERLFDQFWRGQAADGGQPAVETGDTPNKLTAPAFASPPRQPTRSDSDEVEFARRDEQKEVSSPDNEGSAAERAWSRIEVLRHKSFDAMTPEERNDAARLIDELRPSLTTRRTRRVRVHDRGDLLAPRAMLRRSLSTGGDLLYWRWRRPVHRIRPVIILCDVSGSMEPYSRLLLRFTHALQSSDVRVETFVFSMRLTRVTLHLRRDDPDAALAAAAAAVSDWSSGTDIGQALRSFNRTWSARLPLGRAIVLVISDGWARGSPELVAEETARLSRTSHRLLWLNPLAATEGYEPLAAGMAAALPYVDRFMPAENLAHLEQLVALLATNAPTATSRAQQRDRPADGAAPGFFDQRPLP
jgi:uncharacterized protein with von Willebrand factor type A (vWA) domain